MLKIFGCSGEEEVLKAEARGLEEKQLRAEEKVVQLNNELNALKQKYAGAKNAFDDMSLELGLCEQKAKEQAEKHAKCINELTSKVEQLEQEKASVEIDVKRDYTRLGTLDVEGFDQSQLDDAMEQRQMAIEEMNRLRTNLLRVEHAANDAARAADEMKEHYDQKITNLEHQLMYANMQLNDKEVLLQDIPPLHMNILTLQNQLQQAQTSIIGEATVNEWKDELTSKNIEFEKVRYQLEKTTAMNAEHERLIDEQQKQILTNVQEVEDLRRQVARIADLEQQLVAAKREGESANQLMKELNAMTAAKTAVDQEVQRHLAIIDDLVESAAKENNDDVARWKVAYEEMSLTKAVADHNVSQLNTQAHADKEEITALKQTVVELERQSRIAIDEAGKELNELRSQLRTKETRINELAGFVATLTAQNHAAENSISSLTKEALEAERARDHMTMLNNTQSNKAHMETIATLRAENDTLRAALAQKEELVLALGKTQLSDKAIIDELRSLLDASNKKQQGLQDQVDAAAKALKLKEQSTTPLDAGKPLERSRSPSDLIPPKDLDVIPPSNSPLPKYRDAKDTKRLRDLELINDTLLSFSRDAEFQQDLTRPLVRVALDLWKGVNTSHAEMESAKFDAGVIRIYPKLKSFEQQCSSAGLDQFPIDHVEGRRTELSAEAVTKSFGAHFVSNYYLNRAVKHSSP